MAEIIAKPVQGKKRILRNIRVDLTPMVDLGFILITFFMFTATLQEPHEMHFLLPKNSKDSTLLKNSTTLTFLLLQNDIIGYYEGTMALSYAPFSSMRSIIRLKQKDLEEKMISREELSLVIVPGKECSYKNFIDALDEITISDCRHYFVTELKNAE
ncbi:MAG: biopolymer transporter ExbD [Ginsengibacter sp.]